MNLNHRAIYKGRTGNKLSRHGGEYYEEIFVSKAHDVEIYFPIDETNRNYDRIWRHFKSIAVPGDEFNVKLKRKGDSVHVDKYQRVCGNADYKPEPAITQFQKLFS